MPNLEGQSRQAIPMSQHCPTAGVVATAITVIAKHQSPINQDKISITQAEQLKTGIY
ncbi:MAG TPA: hypothetical protein VIQ23_18160 [Hanamia sp.]